MAKRRVLILPGVSGPTASARFREVYAAIEEEATQRGNEFRTALYPGHKGKPSGELSVESAYDSAIATAAACCPHWLIARSFGCDIAVALLSSSEDWVDECEGAVLWGPWVWAQYFRAAPTYKAKAQVICDYAARGTILAPNFFETIPPLEERIRDARCDLRLVRGSRDKETRRSDLNHLAREHTLAQPEYIRQVVEIAGLAHQVAASKTSAELMALYLGSLFDPIVLGK